MTQLTTPISNATRHARNVTDTVGWQRFNDFCQLTKPRITVMVVVTAYVGYAVGTTPMWSWQTLLFTLVGIALSCMGASAFNQVHERDIDSLMQRTQGRPLPDGRMSGRTAMMIALLLCVTGVAILMVMANLLTAALSLFTIASYTLVYTPLKRISSVSTIVGAVPGALPPVMGYTAAAGHIGIEAWLLFGILFLWQLPHFLAIAWLYRQDYARAGIALLPVIDPDGGSTFRQAMLGCLALVPLGLLPTMMGVTGVVYFFGSLAAGVLFLGFAVALVIGQTERHARAMFYASLIYLPWVYVLFLIDRVEVL